MKKNILKKILSLILATIIICVSCGFVVVRAKNAFDFSDIMLMSMKIAMPNGSTNMQSTEEPKSEKVEKPLGNIESEEETANKTSPDNVSHEGERTYPVQEISQRTGNMSFENISVKNTTSFDLDIESTLKKPLPFTIEDNHTAQVLIVHTHTCESYLDDDSDFYYESFYPRTTDKKKNVSAVGDAIAKALKSKGISTVHSTTLHDYPSYDGSYDRSYDTIQEYLKKYPNIKVVLDIHRDSMTADDNTKYKPTFTYEGKKAAQIMIMTGRDVDTDGFPFWDENLIFALKLQKTCEDMYEGFTRPLDFGDFTYNMNVNNGSLLIEVGTDANSLDEAIRSGEMLGNALANCLQNGK